MTPVGPAGSASNRVLAALTLVLAIADGALAVIGSLAWTAYRQDHLPAADVAAFTLLAGSAAVGAVLMLLTTIALLRGAHGHRLARITAGLAGLRLLGLIAATMVTAITVGPTAIIGLTATFTIGMACADAVSTVAAAAIAVRRTR